MIFVRKMLFSTSEITKTKNTEAAHIFHQTTFFVLILLIKKNCL